MIKREPMPQDDVLNIKFRIYREGKALFYASDLDELSRTRKAYTKADLFYNPRMKINRDISIGVARVEGKEGPFIDLMAASGVRPLRWILEAEAQEVFANDINPLAAYMMRKSASLNNVRMRVSCEEACYLARKLRREGVLFNYVDLDPFGSPAPFLKESIALTKTGGVLAVTSTDTSTIFGVNPNKLRRYYGILGAKTPFFREFGIRALIQSVVSIAASLDLAARPLLAYTHMHYVRAYFKVEKGALRARGLIDEGAGWISYCTRCGSFELTKEIEAAAKRSCCGDVKVLGPVWIGSIMDREYLASCVGKTPSVEGAKLLNELLNEIEAPLYYNIDWMSSKLRISPPKIKDVIETLRNLGFQASRTHADRKAVKTDADLKTLRRILLKLSR